LSDDDKERLKTLVESTDLTWDQIGAQFSVNGERARDLYRRMTGNNGRGYAFNRIKESPYPKFTAPLEQEGDCLVLPDPEFPYHHADFINSCIDLALAWNVKQVCIAGDALHFNSISKWEANWKGNKQGLSEQAESALMESVKRLPEKYQQEFIDKLMALGGSADDDVGSEIGVARKALIEIGDTFDDVVYVIGNHDGRFLSALNSPMFATDLKRFVVGDHPHFRIAEYYYSILHTESGDYSIEHPVSASKTTAVNIAVQKHCSVLMGHSHRYSRLRDPSDSYWCIQLGMCVDESRLAYVAQRTRGSEKHSIGATIVRGGYPYDLSLDTPWALWKRL
jgi:hypothetical protein